MGGCVDLGPDCAESKSEEGMPGGGLSSAGPTAAGTSHNAGVKMTGWPRAIGWDEFREIAERPAGVSEDAEIHADNIFSKQIQIIREGGKFRLGPVSAELVIVTENTWVVTEKKSDVLLSHEQGHYDITGLAGRDILRALAKIRAPNVKVLKQRMVSARKRVAALADQVTLDYDDQTSHGLKTEVQKRWKDHIRKCMQGGHSLSSLP